MNTPVEVDIYAHANSTCVMGSRMLNGLGGSGDFLRNSKYSIMHTPSTRPSKTDPHGVSCIVPMCTHVDQTEHDLDVIVTENGLADLQGLSPRERARVIIDKCAHEAYKPILQGYFDKAEFECLRRGMGHEPHLLWNAFDMHRALAERKVACGRLRAGSRNKGATFFVQESKWSTSCSRDRSQQPSKMRRENATIPFDFSVCPSPPPPFPIPCSVQIGPSPDRPNIPHPATI